MYIIAYPFSYFKREFFDFSKKELTFPDVSDKIPNAVSAVYGGIAQLARAFGSYPKCPRFESRCRYQRGADVSPAPFIRPVGQVVKTPPFHGGNMGSSPVRVTKKDSSTEGGAVLFAFSPSGLEGRGSE